MALKETIYEREKAVAYANQWAYRRNPRFYDFSNIGGDCTNFASQCVYAGCRIMNFTPTYGWYYKNVNDRAPSWTSVEAFYNFMVNNKSVGPYAVDASIDEVEPGDMVQLKFLGKSVFGHTPVIVSITDDAVRTTDSIYIAAHSSDCNCRPLSTYKNVIEIRYLHILGARYKDNE